MTKEYRPFPNTKLRMSKLQLTFGLEGLGYELKFGDHNGCELTPTITEQKVYGNTSARKRLRKIFQTMNELDVSVELKDWTPLTYAGAVMGEVDNYLTQVATANGTFEFADPRPDMILPLWKLGVTNVVADGWTENLHYAVHGDHGRIEILSVPAGQNSFDCTYTAMAITAAQERMCMGLLSSRGLRGNFHGESTDEGQDYGLDVWLTELRPDGALPWGSADDKETTVKLKGSAYEVGVMPNGEDAPEGMGFGRFYFSS